MDAILQLTGCAEEVEADSLAALMMAAPAAVAARLGLTLLTDRGAVVGIASTVDVLSLNWWALAAAVRGRPQVLGELPAAGRRAAPMVREWRAMQRLLDKAEASVTRGAAA